MAQQKIVHIVGTGTIPLEPLARNRQTRFLDAIPLLLSLPTLLRMVRQFSIIFQARAEKSLV